MQQKKGVPSLKWSTTHTVLKFDKSKMVVIYMNQVNQENNVPSQLSPQWLCMALIYIYKYIYTLYILYILYIYMYIYIYIDR